MISDVIAFEAPRGSGAAGGLRLALHCGGLRFAPTALALQAAPGQEARPLARHKQSTGLFVSGLACSGPWPRRKTRSVRFAHCARTVAPSQMTMRAARAGHEPCAARRHRGAPAAAPQPRLSKPDLGSRERSHRCMSGRGCPPGALSESASSAGLRAARASALRGLTHGNCLSAVSEANEASFAVRPQAEQRSEVGAKRRPTQSARPAGTPCRDAQHRHAR